MIANPPPFAPDTNSYHAYLVSNFAPWDQQNNTSSSVGDQLFNMYQPAILKNVASSQYLKISFILNIKIFHLF